MGQLKAWARWTRRTMPRNLIIKHDSRAYVHPSSIRNETRRDIVERRAIYRVRKRNVRGSGETPWNLNSTLSLSPLCVYTYIYTCVYVYLRRAGWIRERALGIPRIIWLMVRAERTRGIARPQIERRVKERTDPRVLCVPVYSSGNGKRSSSTLPRYRAALELIAKWCVQHRVKCHRNSRWPPSICVRYHLDIGLLFSRLFHTPLYCVAIRNYRYCVYTFYSFRINVAYIIVTVTNVRRYSK